MIIEGYINKDRQKILRVNKEETKKADWGYVGSIPQQTAYYILFCVFNDVSIASQYCKDFEIEIISKIPTNLCFEIDSSTVEKWYDEKKAGKETLILSFVNKIKMLQPPP